MGQEHKEYTWNLIAKKLMGIATREEMEELELLLRNNPELHYPMQTIMDLWKSYNPDIQREAEQAFNRHLDRMQQLNIDFSSAGLIPLESSKTPQQPNPHNSHHRNHQPPPRKHRSPRDRLDPGHPLAAMPQLRHPKPRRKRNHHRHREHLRCLQRPRHLLQRRIPLSQLSSPPHHPGSLQPSRSHVASPKPLHGCPHQDQLRTLPATGHVRPQILTARRWPLASAQQFRDFHLVRTSPKSHFDLPASRARSSAATTRRARNNNIRTLADASPIISAISLCE